MANNDNISYQNRSTDEFYDPLTDGPYQTMHFNNAEIARDFVQRTPNVYYQEPYQPNESMPVPFMFNSCDVDPPTMVGMTGGNYMVYNPDRNMDMASMHFTNKTNGNLTRVNNYPSEYSTDYNLFSGGVNSVGTSFTEPAISGTPLIDNLVGHWTSDQTGTYTPFGSRIGNVHGRSTSDNINQDRGVRKTRIVAEVRPMRPSYSDVLSKSVSNQKAGKTGDGKKQDIKNGKTSKSSVGRSFSGNGNRHNLSVGDESAFSGSNSSLKTTGMKKTSDSEPRESLPKKWLSLDDLTAGIANNDFINDAKIKKNSPKHNVGKKVKENWETIQINSGKSVGGKAAPGKKTPTPVNVKTQTGPKEKDQSAGLRFEPTKNKSTTDERKATSSSQSKPSDTSKASRRNSRGVQAEKGKKVGRGKRRDMDNGWQAIVVHRADVIAAYLIQAARWFISLVLDVFALSTHLALYMCTTAWCSSISSVTETYSTICEWLRELPLSRRLLTSRFWPFRKSESVGSSSETDSDSDSGEGDSQKKKRKRLPGGLKHNLPLPSTGEEAMKRLLACKGKDPYSILGVSQDCTDDDIKRYYKRQAFLVHPDKNNQPGAEEAFKILVHAFDIIGEPEHRKSYDRSVEKTAQAEQAWSELGELLAQLHKKMEYVANTIRCTNCGKRHKRTIINRPIYAARMCSQCKIHHSAREGDIWAEKTMFGLRWHYMACMDGAVYDISEWAACQGNNLKNLKANTHQVQFRIVLGKQAQKNRSHQPTTASNEPDLEEFINNLYSKPETGSETTESATRNRKHKKKK